VETGSLQREGGRNPLRNHHEIEGRGQNRLGVAVVIGGGSLEEIGSQMNKGVWFKGLNTLGHQTCPVNRRFSDLEFLPEKIVIYKIGSKTNNLALVDHVDKFFENFDNQGHARGDKNNKY
jgi:hypothetical protein